MKTPIELALEALEIAASCGGELDLDLYAQAHTSLQQAVEAVRSHDRRLNTTETAPTGDDYEHIVSLLGLRDCDQINKPFRPAVQTIADQGGDRHLNNF